MTQAEQERKHQERLALIYKPFPAIRVVSSAKTWGGASTMVDDERFVTEKYRHTREDEDVTLI